MTSINTQKEIIKVLIQIAAYDGASLDFLSRLIYLIRPNRKQMKNQNLAGFSMLVQYIEEDEKLKLGLKNYLSRLLKGQKISSSLTNSNIISGIDFWRELKNRLIYKILPYQPVQGSIEYLLVNVFYRPSDGRWASRLDNEVCAHFLGLLGFRGLYEREFSDKLLQEMLFAIRVLSHRITGNAFDMEVLRMVPEYANLESPFAALQDEIDNFLQEVNQAKVIRDKDDIYFKHLHVLILQCREFIQRAYRNKGKYGISFKVHQQLMLMERLLDRLVIVLDFIVIEEGKESRVKLVEFIKALISFNSGRSEVKDYINKSSQLMAREITQNTGEKGEHYITSNSRDYWKMFRTALGGGAIVALACIVKMKLSGLDASLFGKAFLYSMNYATAFIAIYLFHCTLATKQPAMTAARLAQVIEEDMKQKGNFEQLAQLVARVFRSQFIAFAGNVLMAFPVALGIMFLWAYIFDVNIAQNKADVLIQDLNFLLTPVIYHAAIAGVFLFISGLIAGNISNKTKYKNIPIRIKEHPVLKLLLKEKSREKIAGYYERNMGGITSNLWFGILMGCTGTVGVILGLDLDIRHITFAAGNFGLGLYGLNFQITWQVVLISIFGIGLIGFTNFIVSFTLSLLLALRSRGVAFGAIFSIIGNVKKYFLLHPYSFFFPPVEAKVVIEKVDGVLEKEEV
ncbi:MAG: recombinase [Bacteroidetes bacterium]|nr:recombinase [Bacteroidota bacterium]